MSSIHNAPPRRALAWCAMVLALLVAGSARADPVPGQVTIELFTRAGCPHCAEARAYLDALVERRPELRIVIRDVDSDPSARERLRGLAREAGLASPAVPAFHVRGRLLVGFSDAADSRRRLQALLVAPGEAGEQEGGCPVDAACEPVPDRVEVPLVGSVEAGRLGLPLFTVIVGLLDGLNPCATWVLLFLLAMLVNVRSRRKIAVVGGVFILASGAVYYVFMAAWLTVFAVLGVSHAVAVVLGLLAVFIGLVNVKDFFALKQGLSLSIPEAARPGLYGRVRRILAAEHLAAAAAAAAVLALLVNLVEVLCTAGLPAVYTAILTAQGLPSWQHYGYILLYVAAYMVDDAILLSLAIVTLRKFKLQERGARVLKLLSGTVMLVLGALLLARPDWLGW